MYNSEFICTYPFYDNELAKNNPITIKYMQDKKTHGQELESQIIDDADIAEYIYKNELLHAFFLEDYSDTMNKKMQTLYNTVAGHENKEGFMSCIEKLMEIQQIDDTEIAFSFLFSYDYFHITHLCICDMLLNKPTKENTDMLLNNITKHVEHVE
jgi:hypothetical protein